MEVVTECFWFSAVDRAPVGPAFDSNREDWHLPFHWKLIKIEQNFSQAFATVPRDFKNENFTVAR